MDRSFCIAPMMARTDKHFRYLVRQLTKKAVLFTEMIHTNSILFGNRNKLDDYFQIENPIVLQLGGNDPESLSKVCQMAENYNYDEINLNLGCPSPKVKSGNFGAALMNHPEIVQRCLVAMQENSSKTISVKIRLGINDNDIDESLDDFIYQLSETGIKVFYVHARKAILDKLSPKDNREIPPLNYARVKKLKQDFPNLEIIINGGITKVEEINNHLKFCDGVMIGRSIYQNPYSLIEIEKEIFNTKSSPTREQVVEKLLEYADREVKLGTKINHIMRHTVGLYHGQVGSKEWKRYLSDNMMARDSDFQKAKHIMTIVQNNEKAIQANS